MSDEIGQEGNFMVDDGEGRYTIPEELFDELHVLDDQYIPLSDPQDGGIEQMTNCKRPKTDQALQDPSPLGLSLKKTESFVNLIHMMLQGKIAPSSESTKNIILEKQMIRNDKRNTEPIAEKLKALNFPAILLKIGSWHWVSENEGDIVAKCYYAKRKLVWEILDNGLKKKFEIQWSDISAMKARYGNEHPDILEVELKRPPLFFEETNPQPRKHTSWQSCSDFTEGQAPLIRRHYVEFTEGTLEKHYEKLLHNKHLNVLSQEPFTSDHSPFFGAVHSEVQDLSMLGPQLHMFNQPTNNLYHFCKDHFDNQGTINLPTQHFGNVGCMGQFVGPNLPVRHFMSPLRPVNENLPISDISILPAIEHTPSILNHPSNMEHASSFLNNKASSTANLEINCAVGQNLQTIEEHLMDDHDQHSNIDDFNILAKANSFESFMDAIVRQGLDPEAFSVINYGQQNFDIAR